MKIYTLSYMSDISGVKSDSKFQNIIVVIQQFNF